MLTTVTVLKLNNGVEMPQLGFGVFQVPPAETKATVKTARDAGYRFAVGPRPRPPQGPRPRHVRSEVSSRRRAPSQPGHVRRTARLRFLG